MSIDEDIKLAELRKAEAEAREAEEKARAAQISALVPDLSKVERGTLEVEGESPLFSGIVAHHAMQSAVDAIDAAVRRQVGRNDTDLGAVLVTTNDLASSDAVYVQTSSALRHLTNQAEELLGQDGEGEGDSAIETSALGPAVMGAAASALPGLLSLTSSNRTVKTFSGTVAARSAAVAIAGALQDNANTSVYLDDLRVLGDSQVLADAVHLDRLRARLARRVAAQGDTEDAAKGLLDDINAFLVAVHAAPSDGGRAPIVTAALYEGLHTIGGDRKFTHVLWVNGVTAATQHAIDDRPLWFEDQVSVLGTVSIPWSLVDVEKSEIIAGGVETSSVQISGEIGKTFQVEAVRVLQ